MLILFDSLANLELNDACQYYEIEIPGLGKRFKDEIKKSIKRILQYPEAWPVEKGDIRRYVLHKFPYKILYSIENEYIYVIAIAHCHRKPDYWLDRVTNKLS